MKTILEKLDRKEKQIQRIKENYIETEKYDDTQLRLMSNDSFNEKELKERFSCFTQPAILLTYKKATRNYYEEYLMGKIERLRNSAEMHRLECDPNSDYSKETIFSTDKKAKKAQLAEADEHDADADYYETLLQESFSTPYEDRRPRKIPKILPEGTYFFGGRK
ncbi:MAG: hypothetical protein ABIB79_04820 [archaeon]